ncbi:hypothetical protein [Dictyobacter aurantiacus]|uniref:Uncharacterized protein n=1 Tax=Dictyobacter aurantiacus TaxID=1936993 RepID=A0A401ZCR4_9CHLR|nr:hypothetical protein [Dictyobacter aurantiacus]GCE04645.1 hypothetical protein KDAU_19740 [Dictyobacter aurantiacus]
MKNSLYVAEVLIDPNKTVASIQLPPASGGTMHIFAVGERAGNLNNIGITNSGATSIGAFDHYHGSSYSAQALQSQGLVSGQNFSSNGYSFPWPAAGTLDNYAAAGQTLPVTAPANASGVAFLGSATNGGAVGDVTITYTDGSTQTDSLAFLDWCNATRSIINWYPIIAATMPYRNTQGGQQTINNYIYFSEFKLDSTKTVQSITLPQSGTLHVFSYAFK